MPETSQENTEVKNSGAAEPGFYCPGCGRRVSYPQRCQGVPERPHQPIEVVSVDELSGDPESHTAAPPSVDLG